MVCLPYAGGSSIIYYRWIEQLKDVCEIIPVDYPGHGKKVTQAFATSYYEMLLDIYEDIIEKVKDKEFVIFGHSMGAYVAFDLCKIFIRNFQTIPEFIILSSANDPGHRIKLSYATQKGDELDWKSIANLGGTPKEILLNEEYRKYFEPIFLNDFRILDSISEVSSPIQVSIYVCWGDHDPIITESGVFGWKELSGCNVEMKKFVGGHFYCFEENSHTFIDYLKNILCEVKR